MKISRQLKVQMTTNSSTSSKTVSFLFGFGVYLCMRVKSKEAMSGDKPASFVHMAVNLCACSTAGAQTMAPHCSWKG